MAYTWAQFKAAVIAFITDRTPSDDSFVEATAEYVKARVFGDLVGDDKMYAIHENKFRSLRRRLAGFQTTLNDTTLQARVRALISDTTSGDNLFVQAVGYYVKAELYRMVAGDVNLADSANKSYLQLRPRLVGFSTTLDSTTLGQRVRAAITDTTASNNLFAQAVAYYVKSEICREVNRDVETAESYRKSYLTLRVRLAGFNHSLGTGLRAAVNPYLPVDAARGGNVGTATSGTSFVDALISSAVDDLQGMGGIIDGLISDAKDDLQGYGPWLNAQIGQAKLELNTLGDRVQQEIRQGVIDLQHYIDVYRVGHNNTFEEGDVTQNGYASQGTMPDQARITDAWIVYETFGNPEVHRDKVAIVSWDQRQEAMLGKENDSAQMAIDPYGTTFLCTPRLDDSLGISLLVYWDGLKLDFADTDTVPFDEGAVKAIGAYVQAELAMELGDPIGTVREMRSDYARLRKRLYIEARERRSILDDDATRDEPGYPTRTDDPLP